MTILTFQLPSIDLDKLIASYGIIEEVSQNKKYLEESIQLAMEISGAPAAYVSILDSKNQHIITAEGLADFPQKRDQSICQLTVSAKKVTIISDTRVDSRVCGLEGGKGEYTFYAGFPLINSENVAIGSLCILDKQSQELDAKDIKVLNMIANGIVSKFDARRSMIKLIKDINKSFKPAACSDLACLTGELAHLQNEVLETSEKLKSQKEELKIVNKNLSQFAHRIAHDLKAPLRSINGFTQLIKRQIDKQGLEYDPSQFEIVKTSTSELFRMIDNVLSIAEMKANVVREKVSISAIVDKVEIFLAGNLAKNEVTFVKPEVDVLVMGYKDLLHQLFQNIISNAIKYRSKDRSPNIEVSFELQDTSVLVKIADNGKGISKEDLNNIFQPFKRVDTEEEVSGLGIGLDTCNTIVQDMGSELKVESELGVGTTFSFEIPYDFVQVS